MIKNMKALQADVLNQVNGGVLKSNATDAIDSAVTIYRDRLGMDLDRVKELIVESYHRNRFEYSTDGSEEDLQDYLRRFEDCWYHR